MTSEVTEGSFLMKLTGTKLYFQDFVLGSFTFIDVPI